MYSKTLVEGQQLKISRESGLLNLNMAEKSFVHNIVRYPLFQPNNL